KLHQAYRFAIAFRPRHAEIVLEAAFGARSFLVADHANALAVKSAEAADDGLVLAEFTVAGERGKISDEAVDEIETVRPLRMSRDLRLLPRCQIGIDLLQRRSGLGLDTTDFFGD